MGAMASKIMHPLWQTGNQDHFGNARKVIELGHTYVFDCRLALRGGLPGCS
jgi:hypothetical protein